MKDVVEAVVDYIGRNPVPSFALIAAVIGFAGVIAGTYFKAKFDRDLETEKAVIARRDGLRKELQSLVSQLAVQFSTAVHAMHWVTWFVKEQPSTLTQNRLDKYNDEMRAVLPQIMGTEFAIAIMDEQVGKSVREAVEALYKLDGEIASLGPKFPAEQAKVQQGLIEYWENVHALEERFKTKLRGTLVRKGVAIAGPLPTDTYRPANKRLCWG
jgi:hypothetical protein